MTGTGAIDMHAHYLPPSYRTALAHAGVDRPDGFPHVPAWSAATAISIMDEAAIAAALLSVSSPGLHFLARDERPALARAVNTQGAEAVRAHPRRFGLLASLPLPDVDPALEEIAHACDALHADGFVLMSNDDGVYLGDPRLEPVMDELDRRGALSVLTDRVRGFTSAFGDAHDVFAVLRSLWFDITGDPFPNALAALVRIADPDRILYGSDTPFAPPPVIARSARALRDTEIVSGAQRAALLRENALALVPRLAEVAA